jgi:type III secretion protein S
MEYENLIRLTSEALLLCLMVSLPVVLSSAIVGLLVSFMQAITSLQDQSILVTIVIVVAAPWGASIIFRFAETILKVAIQ